MGLVHLLLSFFKARDKNRKLQVGQGRDGLALCLLMSALHRLGFGVGEVLLNYPPPPGREQEILEIDISGMRAADILLEGTRPPLSDEDEGPRKNIPKGYTSLEILTHRVWALYFHTLSRGTMILQPWLRPMIRTDYQNRRDVQFFQSERSDYSTLNACDGRGESKVSGIGRTAAFLLNQPSLWPGGPTHLGFFGMDGSSTLAWAYLLLHRHSDLLLRPGFHMIELTSAPIPDRVPDMRWALDWKAEVILSAPPAELPPSEAPLGPKHISEKASRRMKRADNFPRI